MSFDVAKRSLPAIRTEYGESGWGKRLPARPASLVEPRRPLRPPVSSGGRSKVDRPECKSWLGRSSGPSIGRLIARCPEHGSSRCDLLIRDLKPARAYSTETLVVWGRGNSAVRPVLGGGRRARDHDPYGYTMWDGPGGGNQGRALTYGATGRIRISRAVENRVSNPRSARHPF